MNTTGTVIVSALVGAAVGFAVGRFTTPPPCQNHRIVVSPTTPKNLGDAHVCTTPAPGNTVRWESTGGNITVVWKRMEPANAQPPYTLPCSTAASSNCDSGPLAPTAQKGLKAYYELRIDGVGGDPWNGRIIIDK